MVLVKLCLHLFLEQPFQQTSTNKKITVSLNFFQFFLAKKTENLLKISSLTKNL